EVQPCARPAQPLLNIAMGACRVDVIVGTGVGAPSLPPELPPSTVVGAPTRAGLLPAPLRDRFGFIGHLDFYSPEELREVVDRSAAQLELELTDDSAAEIACRSRGTPRIANRLLRRPRVWARVRG